MIEKTVLLQKAVLTVLRTSTCIYGDLQLDYDNMRLIVALLFHYE